MSSNKKRGMERKRDLRGEFVLIPTPLAFDVEQ